MHTPQGYSMLQTKIKEAKPTKKGQELKHRDPSPGLPRRQEASVGSLGLGDP